MNRESLLKLREIMEYENIRSVEIKDCPEFQAAAFTICDDKGICKFYVVPNENYAFCQEGEE